MKKHLFLLALGAAFLATSANDYKRIADLHRLRDDAFRDDPPDEEEAKHIAAFLRAAEIATPTADAKAAAERLAVFLEKRDGGYSFESPNGPEGNGRNQPFLGGEPSSPESSTRPASPSPDDAPPADETGEGEGSGDGAQTAQTEGSQASPPEA